MIKSNKNYGLAKRQPFGGTLLAPLFSQLSLFDEENGEYPALQGSNISLSEDDKNVFVEANLPGLKEEDIEISLDKGLLWIKGESKKSEENKEKKYYYRATRSFSYHLALPSNINESSEPVANFKDGVIYITFKKAVEEKPKKIKIKKS